MPSAPARRPSVPGSMPCTQFSQRSPTDREGGVLQLRRPLVVLGAELSTSSALPVPYTARASCSIGPSSRLRRAEGSPLLLPERLFALGPGLDHLDEARGVVDVLFAAPFTVAGVLQDRHVGCLVDAAIAGIFHPIQDLGEDPPA